MSTTTNNKPTSPLPPTAAERKTYPIYRGLLQYFPDALAAIAHMSYVCNEQHNPGEEIHWSREKSSDHHDCLMRHLMECGKVDDDGQRHAVKMAWRALAIAQLEIEGAEEVAQRDRYCYNCRHAAVSFMDDPCASCETCDDPRCKWEPAKEANS